MWLNVFANVNWGYYLYLLLKSTDLIVHKLHFYQSYVLLNKIRRRRKKKMKHSNLKISTYWNQKASRNSIVLSEINDFAILKTWGEFLEVYRRSWKSSECRERVSYSSISFKSSRIQVSVFINIHTCVQVPQL